MAFNAFIYFSLLTLWSAWAAYQAVFVIFAKPGMRHGTSAHASHHHRGPHKGHGPRGRYSQREGFKSFARGLELTVEDIVKGLSRDE